jgi:hypothetical protein
MEYISDSAFDNIVPNGDSGKILNNDALDNFKSIHYYLKGKRDTFIKLFHDGKLFTREDILELNRLVHQKLYFLNIQGSITSITIELNNKEIKDFGNWAEFERHEWFTSAQTISINIIWDFNVIFPNQPIQELPQPHNMRVRIGGGLRPNEFFHVVMNGGEDFDVEQAMSEMVCKIDFVNDHLCNELKNIVSDWYDCLVVNKPTNKWIVIISKHKGKISLIFITFFLSLCILICNIGVRAFIEYIDVSNQSGFFKWQYFLITVTVPIIYVCLITSQFYANRIIDRTIFKFRQLPTINLTKGDKNSILSIKEANNKLMKQFVEKGVITIAIGFVTYVIGQFLPTIIKSAANYFLSK